MPFFNGAAFSCLQTCSTPHIKTQKAPYSIWYSRGGVLSLFWQVKKMCACRMRGQDEERPPAWWSMIDDEQMVSRRPAWRRQAKPFHGCAVWYSTYCSLCTAFVMETIIMYCENNRTVSSFVCVGRTYGIWKFCYLFLVVFFFFWLLKQILCDLPTN